MKRRTAVVSGMVAADAGQGGASSAVLQWIFGLQRNGFDVVLIEPIDDCEERPLSATSTATYFERVVTAAGMAGRAALVRRSTGESVGMDPASQAAACKEAAVLLNVSGMLPLSDPINTIPVRVYLDLDPGFIQFWHAQGVDMRFEGHTHHASVGTRLGAPGCSIPTHGLDWIATLPPVDLTRWPVAKSLVDDALTTVGNWRSYGSVYMDGVQYGQKAHSMRELLPLARRSPKRLALAFAIDPAEVDDLSRLRQHGWTLQDPAVVASDPARYQAFVQGSWAELGVAKAGYVVSRSGWFSDRSACYLASGRPVIAQDTGFAGAVPPGDGLFAFSTVDDAVDAIGRVKAEYARQRVAARRLAETHFEAGMVVRRLLREVDVEC
jgi:hypothetical protein